MPYSGSGGASWWGGAYPELHGSKLGRKDPLCVTLAGKIDPSHDMPKGDCYEVIERVGRWPDVSGAVGGAG